MPLTPAQRHHRARIAAFASHANSADPTSRTAAARRAFFMRFVRQVDPEGVLPEAERLRRAEQAFQAHMAKLAFKAVRVREAAKDKRRSRVASALAKLTDEREPADNDVLAARFEQAEQATTRRRSVPAASD